MVCETTTGNTVSITASVIGNTQAYNPLQASCQQKNSVHSHQPCSFWVHLPEFHWGKPAESFLRPYVVVLVNECLRGFHDGIRRDSLLVDIGLAVCNSL